MKKKPTESETPTYDPAKIVPEPGILEAPSRKSRTYPRGQIIILQATPDNPGAWAVVPCAAVLSGKRDGRDYAEANAFAGKFKVVEILDEFETEVVNTPVVKFK